MSAWLLRIAARPAEAVAACLLVGLAACAAPQQGTPATPATPAPDATADAAATLPPPCRATVAAPRWWHTAVGYEVFVRSFADSDGDGIGDLQGLLQKLDHLNDGKPGQGDDLEVDLLWLMPVHASPSYHGYDVTDYRAIEPDYGSEQDLQAVLQAAHARGMRVVVDLVLNHTSSQHPWFLASAAGTGQQDWYVWSGQKLDWKQPWGGAKTWHPHGDRWYYGVFWSGMPDLDWRTPAVRTEMTDVARFWLQRGVDGYRLDAVRYLVETGPGPGQQETAETLAIWRQFAQDVAQAAPEALLVGEAWAADTVASRYHGQDHGQGQGQGLAMTFDFDLAAALVGAIDQGDGGKLQKAVCDDDGLFPPGAARGTFLTNHDMIRVATQLADGDRTGRHLRLVAALLFALPGTPFVYYGEELGLPNGQGQDDRDKRQPMPWQAGPGAGFSTGTPWYPLPDGADTLHVAAQRLDPASLLAHYRRLVRLRKQHPALSIGSLTPLPAPDGTWAFLRQHGSQRVLCVFRLAPTAGAELVARAADLGPLHAVTDLWTGQSVAVDATPAEGAAVRTGPLQPGAFRLLALD